MESGSAEATSVETASSEDNARLPSWMWVAAGLVGLAIAGLGLLLLLLSALFPAFFAPLIVIVAGDGLIGLGLGVALVIAGYRRRRALPAQRFSGVRGWWVFLILGLLALVAGILLPSDTHRSLLFAPVYLALIVAPAFFFLSIVTLASGPRLSIAYPHLALALSGGASSVLLAAPVEILGLVLSGVVTTVAAMFIPGGEGEIDRLMMLLDRWSAGPPTDPEQVLSLVASPIILATLALTLALVTPLVEEFSKALIVGLVGFWLKPGPLSGFLWGVAAGLGFALVEGVSNGALPLGETAGWFAGAGTRFFTTAMHGLTSGLVGLGWSYFWRRPDPRRWLLPLFYGLAALFHALWNLNVISTLASLSLGVSTPVIGGSVIVLGVVVQVTLALGALAGLLGVPFLLKRHSTA
ncbi:MAG: PrsW family glutamic-type intramembrane protease [Anaerolineae bacterium]